MYTLVCAYQHSTSEIEEDMSRYTWKKRRRHRVSYVCLSHTVPYTDDRSRKELQQFGRTELLVFPWKKLGIRQYVYIQRSTAIYIRRYKRFTPRAYKGLGKICILEAMKVTASLSSRDFSSSFSSHLHCCSPKISPWGKCFQESRLNLKKEKEAKGED